MKRTAMTLAILLMAGCSYPSSTVSTIDSRPRIAISNAAPDAILLINGVEVGPAAAYDGKKQTLQLDRGTHKLAITRQGRIVFETTIYLGDDVTKTITVP